MKTREHILAEAQSLSLEDQCWLRDRLSKRPRGRPRGSRVFALKDEALKFFEALPATMTEFEKFQSVRARFPQLSWGPLTTLIAGKDWRFNATKNRNYSWNETNPNPEQE